MGQPEATPDPEHDRAQRESPPAGATRPDWLVGAEEGAQSEYHRGEAPPVELRLVRPAPASPPTGSPRPTGAGADAPPGLPLASRRTAEAPPARPVAWTAAGSSVPRLVQRPQAIAAAPDAAPDDPFASDPTLEHALPGADEDKAPPLAPRALDEPWWMVAGERLATDRRLQIIVLAAVATIAAAWMLWPRDGAGVSVREIRRHADEWEGRAVHVTGRVGEVFTIGQGVVFYLHQGRDTIVVFSRSRSPEPRQRVSVDGTVSTGYLDGAPRVAILESVGP